MQNEFTDSLVTMDPVWPPAEILQSADVDTSALFVNCLYRSSKKQSSFFSPRNLFHKVKFSSLLMLWLTDCEN